MGQKTNPIGNRIGIIRGWESNWFGGRDYGDKLSEDKKKPIEDALEELKKSFESKDLEKIDPALEKINEAWKAASEEMYKAQQNQQGKTEQSADNNSNESSDNVEDVDFEEVKE